VTLARSTDGGQTFENYAWSDRTYDPRGTCLGDYIGIAALGGLVYGAWPEDVPTEEPQVVPPALAQWNDKPLDNAAWPSRPTAIRVASAIF